MQEKYLIFVSEDNHNKFYHMIPSSDGSAFTVEYGRVGNNSPSTCYYSASQFNKKLQEKLNKGYTDVTDLHRTVSNSAEYKQISNSEIREIVNKLISMSREAVKNNYNVSATAVTDEMIDEAQLCINDLACTSSANIQLFNNKLIELFKIIPRKMSTVEAFLAHYSADVDSIISREQSLLDNLKVNKQTSAPSNISPDKTILEEIGVEFEMPTAEEVKQIKALMGESAYKFSRAWKVTNNKSRETYEQFVKTNNIKNTKLLFHGSRNENWFSIIKQGLRIRPANAVYTGSLYGDGLYFAPKCKKSIGYTSLSGSYWANGSAPVGYLALMEVAYGTPYDVYSFDSKYHSLSYDNLQKFKHGANCLHAHAGASMGGSSALKNDEIVFYKSEQVTIKYLIEIKN